jgi:hypothetical protein
MLEDIILKAVGVSGVGGLILMASRGIYRAYKEEGKQPHSIIYRRDLPEEEEEKGHQSASGETR